MGHISLCSGDTRQLRSFATDEEVQTPRVSVQGSGVHAIWAESESEGEGEGEFGLVGQASLTPRQVSTLLA